MTKGASKCFWCPEINPEISNVVTPGQFAIIKCWYTTAFHAKTGTEANTRGFLRTDTHIKPFQFCFAYTQDTLERGYQHQHPTPLDLLCQPRCQTGKQVWRQYPALSNATWHVKKRWKFVAPFNTRDTNCEPPFYKKLCCRKEAARCLLRVCIASIH